MLRILGDPRVAAALGELADALEAHATLPTTEPRTAAPTPSLAPVPAPDVTKEHRRDAERRLRKAGVIP